MCRWVNFFFIGHDEIVMTFLWNVVKGHVKWVDPSKNISTYYTYTSFVRLCINDMKIILCINDAFWKLRMSSVSLVYLFNKISNCHRLKLKVTSQRYLGTSTGTTCVCIFPFRCNIYWVSNYKQKSEKFYNITPYLTYLSMSNSRWCKLLTKTSTSVLRFWFRLIIFFFFLLENSYD